MIAQQERIAPSAWSPKTAQIIQNYAPRSAQRDRQLDELTLVVVHGALIVLSAALLALVGWISSVYSPRVEGAVAFLGVAVLAALCTGLFLHLTRYYDALISRRRVEQGEKAAAIRWPRASSDADFLIAIGLGVLVAVVTG
jgi:uncharacterized membrane-anchored protein